MGGQAVVRVAQELLAAPAVQDLRAGGAPDGGPRRAGHRDDRVVQILDRHRIRRGWRRHEARIAGVAAGAGAGGGRRAVAEVLEDRGAAAAVLLHIGPDLTVLAPARLDPLL